MSQQAAIIAFIFQVRLVHCCASARLEVDLNHSMQPITVQRELSSKAASINPQDKSKCVNSLFGYEIYRARDIY
jgi:hypothetical protein